MLVLIQYNETLIIKRQRKKALHRLNDCEKKAEQDAKVTKITVSPLIGRYLYLNFHFCHSAGFCLIMKISFLISTPFTHFISDMLWELSFAVIFCRFRLANINETCQTIDEIYRKGNGTPPNQNNIYFWKSNLAERETFFTSPNENAQYKTLSKSVHQQIQINI